MKAASNTRWVLAMVCAAALLSAAVELLASGPIAVYAIVEKVALEPDDKNPQRIQIWGAFALEKEPWSSNYGKAEKGYLYYKVPGATARDDRIRAIWADIKKSAGTGEAIGFGGGESGKVRKATEKPSSPSEFPAGNPVVKLGTAQPRIAAELKAALQAK